MRTGMLLLFVIACSPPSEPIAPDLKAAIERANEAFVRATRASDPAHLECCFTGEILRNLSASLRSTHERGNYAVSTLRSISWGPSTRGADTASVVTTERWEHVHHQISDGQCVFRVPARDVQQTYYLAKRSGAWVIQRIVDDPDNPPSRAAKCT